MTTIHKSATVPFSAEQMYGLVNDIDAYQDFLPWCVDSRVLCRGEAQLTASLSFAAGNIRQTLTTENRMQPERRIDVRLLSGPFRHLSGSWQLEPAGDKSCHISLQMDFEFRNKIIQLALDKVFSRIINSLIESFTDRAHQIYGSQ